MCCSVLVILLTALVSKLPTANILIELVKGDFIKYLS